MKKLILACFILGCVLTSCNKEKIDPSDCANLENTKIISEAKKATACDYSEVFRYEGEIYTVPECCTCDMAYMAFDCSGTALCESDVDCMIDFRANAEYLYAIQRK